MNDTELDELLDTWQSPAPLESMRENLQAEMATKRVRPPRKRFTRWRLTTVAALVVFALLVVNPDAFSTRVPTYTVDSEITHYDGSLRWTEWPRKVLMTSYNEGGSEVILSWSFPGYPIDTAFLKMLALADGTVERVHRRFYKLKESYYIWKYDLKTAGYDFDKNAVVYPQDPDDRPTVIAERAELLSSGCRTNDDEGEVVGEDVILNYNTVGIRQTFTGGKRTLWMAPELSCFALRATIHRKQDDGTWKVVTEKKAVKVTVNR